MQNRNQSSILLIARKLAALRFRLMPNKSRREAWYLNIARPSIMWLLARGKTQPMREDSHGENAQYFNEVSLRSNGPIRSDDVKEILLIKCDHIGDFLLALQAFVIIKRGFPNARITLMCGAWNKDLALQSGLFDEIVTINVFAEVSSQDSGAFNAKIIENYKLPFYDLAIDLKVETDTQFLFNYIKAKFKAGFEDFGLTLNQSPQHHPIPALDFVFSPPSLSSEGKPNRARHAQALMAAFASGIVNYFDSQELSRQALAPFLQKGPSLQLVKRGNGPLIGINTGSGSPIRNWSLARYVDGIRHLIAKHDATIVLMGAKSQEDDGQVILRAIGDKNIINCINVVSLAELPALIHQLDLYVGHDTGGTHLSGLLGQKTLCIHAGSSPLESYGPVGENVTVLKCQDLPCSPCGLTKLSECHHDHACMTLIKTDIVVTACEQLLNLTAA